jgi:toxin FitB
MLIYEWLPARHQLHFRVVRIKPESRVLEWMAAADERLLYLSVLRLGEIRKGVVNLPESKRRAHLESWLDPAT